jgi:hypothetical protein
LIFDVRLSALHPNQTESGPVQSGLRRAEAKELYESEDYSRFCDKMKKKVFGWV